jgi:putative transposase
MTVAQKVDLVAAAKDEYGLGSALAALGLAKATWYYHGQHPERARAAKYAHLRAPLEQVLLEHPEYGVRRIAPELQALMGMPIGKKLVEALLKMWDFPLLRGTHHPKPSGIRQAIDQAGTHINLVATLWDIDVLDVVYTDFTEIVYANGRRKAHLMPLVDHASKVVVGWALEEHQQTPAALAAWGDAQRTLKAWGIQRPIQIVHHDQDSVYTSYEWTARLLLDDHVRLSYTLHGCKDNPEMESFNSRFKDENAALFLEAETLDALRDLVAERIRYYNRSRRHSSIGYVAPLTYLMEALKAHP